MPIVLVSGPYTQTIACSILRLNRLMTQLTCTVVSLDDIMGTYFQSMYRLFVYFHATKGFRFFNSVMFPYFTVFACQGVLQRGGTPGDTIHGMPFRSNWELSINNE